MGSAPRLDRLDRNILINGGLHYWQRNTSFSPVSTEQYTADRWVVGRFSGSMTAGVSRAADVPASDVPFSLDVGVVTTQSSLATTDRFGVYQTIEGTFSSPHYSKKWLLKFWVKSNRTGTYGAWVANNPYTHTWVSSYTINASDVWEEKTIIVDMSTRPGTWQTGTGMGAYLYFTLASAVAGQTSTLNQWQAASVGLAPTGQTNLFASAGGYWRVSKVRLIPIEVTASVPDVTDFVFAGANAAEELLLCQRYYEIAGSMTDLNPLLGRARNNTGATNDISLSASFRAEKRAAPVVTVRRDISDLGQVNDNVTYYLGREGFTHFVALTNGQFVDFIGWTANAEF